MTDDDKAQRDTAASAEEDQSQEDAGQDEASVKLEMTATDDEHDGPLVGLFNELVTCWVAVPPAKVFICLGDDDDDDPLFYPAWGSDDLRELRRIGAEVLHACEKMGPEFREVAERVRVILQHDVYGPTDGGKTCLLLSDEDCWTCHEACKELLNILSDRFDSTDRVAEAYEVAENAEDAISCEAGRIGAPVFDSAAQSEATRSPDELLASLLDDMSDTISPFSLTEAEMLAFLERGRSTLYGWRRKRQFPSPECKRYPLLEVVQWCNANGETYDRGKLPTDIKKTLEAALLEREEKRLAEVREEAGRRHADNGGLPDDDKYR